MIYEVSVGAYMKVVFPLLKDWNSNKSLRDQHEIFVDKIIPGYDDKRRHVDTVIHLTFNDVKTTVCVVF